jgi:hypothetical protein
MVRRAALLVLALQALGCTPQLASGSYDCTDGGSCPPGWFCRSDGRCHDSLLHIEDRCTGDEDCSSDICSIDVRGSSAGYCTLGCEDDADCNDLDGSQRCVDGHCLVSCEEECPAGTQCQIPHVAMTVPPMEASCAMIDDPAYNGQSGCSNFLDCEPPGFCLGTNDASIGSDGVCSMWCTNDDHCAGGFCVTILESPDRDPIRHCLYACFPGQEPCMRGLECGRLLGDDAPPGEVCIPPSWAGRTLPLPGGMIGPPM